MKKTLNIAVGSAIALALPAVTLAQGFQADGGNFGTLLGNILVFVNGTLIPFIIGIGFLVFVWGMFRYFIAGGANEEAKESGKSLMIWATVGFVVIVIFWGVINLIATSTGYSGGSAVDNTQVKGITLPAAED